MGQSFPLTNIFQDGWNHQPVYSLVYKFGFVWKWSIPSDGHFNKDDERMDATASWYRMFRRTQNTPKFQIWLNDMISTHFLTGMSCIFLKNYYLAPRPEKRADHILLFLDPDPKQLWCVSCELFGIHIFIFEEIFRLNRHAMLQLHVNHHADFFLFAFLYIHIYMHTSMYI